jgi:hypothetical protein
MSGQLSLAYKSENVQNLFELLCFFMAKKDLRHHSFASKDRMTTTMMEMF